jgi:hypothetical protein
MIRREIEGAARRARAGRVAGLLAAALGVAGCVPGIALPVPTPKGPPPVSTDIADPVAVKAREGAGAILVIRERVLRDAKCTYDVLLDNRFVAGLRSGERVTLYADPGRRVVGISVRSADDCEPAVAQVPLDVVAHATTTLRVKASVQYDLQVEATTN